MLKKTLFRSGHHDGAASFGLLLLRLGAGGMMIAGHGWGKLHRLATQGAGQFPDPLGIGHPLSLAGVVGAECLCAALVMLGLATRWAVLPLAFTMGVAAFVVNAGSPWGDKELAAL